MSRIYAGLRAFVAGTAAGCALAAFAVSCEAQTSARVGIGNFTFDPAAITVRAGTQVEWVNADDIPHSIVETAGKFRSAALDTAGRFSFTFAQPGVFDYFCGLHPQMVGKIMVTP